MGSAVSYQIDKMGQTENHGDDLELPKGRISFVERANILNEIGEIAKKKYDEFVVQGGNVLGYNLLKLKGALKFVSDAHSFANAYYLKKDTKEWTDIAYYFEYGTGLHNVTRAGKYRAGYIKPVVADHMTFLSKKFNRWVKTDRVRGVRPVFAMTKALKYIETLDRRELRRRLRIDDVI